MNPQHERRRKREKVLARRTFLRGAGVTIGLPWLESLSGFGIGAASAATTAAQPQRFAVLFMGTGISPGRWWAKGAGAAMELSESLAPLEPLKAKSREEWEKQDGKRTAALPVFLPFTMSPLAAAEND